ncbi:MAG: exodeoxyribonuclease VII small subunit [Acidothermus sp.]|nr:exodeoxyribonuclease VII small subunit [Acidothermus sp.]MCL6537906.1 exodeoxyribonuclease VII small subunit [Acidothermus sp.]
MAEEPDRGGDSLPPSPDDDPLPTSYEAARGELERIVQELERGGLSLEDSLALWERGERLAQICESWLAGARARLEAVRKESEASGPAADIAGDGDS